MIALLPGLLLACSGDFAEQGGDPTVADWGGPAGTYLELAPVGSPDSVPLLIEIGEATWELRFGELWRTAQQQGVLGAGLDEAGYRVDDSLLVPGLEAGASAEGTTVRDRGEVETWYGTFEDALSVDVGSGTFRGSAAFAVEVGPIWLSWEGLEWELVYYARE